MKGNSILKMEQLLQLQSYVEELNGLSIILRIVCSTICGGVLGLERGKANQSAGMRTYILVCLGSTLAMMTGEYTFYKYGTGDPARLGAQVISGIGFLGAGSIIVEGRTKIRGLTTAASLWTAACIGLAFGVGFYSGGIVATAIVYLVVSKFKNFSDHLTHKDSVIRVYIEFDEMLHLNLICQTIESFGFQILDTTLNNPGNTGYYNVIVSMKNPANKMHEQIMEYLKKIQGITQVKILA